MIDVDSPRVTENRLKALEEKAGASDFPNELSDYDSCDDHELSFLRIEGCPFCMQIRIAELEAENEQLSQQICDECSPDDYGWNYNAVEGRVPCVCIIESGAYQELKAALERAQHDINWMLNNRQFLSGYVFDYIDKALNQQEGDCRE